MPRFLSSLRYRLILLVLLSTLPAFVLTITTGLERRTLAAQAVKNEALRLTRLASSNQDAIIEGARTLLVTLAQVPQLNSGGNGGISECNQFLHTLITQYPSYASITVVDPKGSVLCGSTPLSGPVNIADRAYFQQALNGRGFVVGEYVYGRVSKKPVLPFAYPVLDQSNEIKMVIVASLDVAWLERLSQQVQLPAQSSLLIVDRNGTILTRFPNPEQWSGKNLPEAPIIQKILLQQGEGTAEVPGLDGVRRLFAFTPLQGGGQTYVGIGIPNEIAYADVNRTLLRDLLTLGLVAALAVGAAWATGELFILRQVHSLLGATRRLQAGDLKARSGMADGYGELGQLGSAFNRMAQALEDREARLRHAEARYRSLVEQIPGVTYMIPLDGNIFTAYISPQVQNLLGISPEEWMRDDGIWRNSIHPEDREGAISQIESARAQGKSYDMEYRFITCDGREVWLRDEAVIVKDQQGHPQFVQGLLIDISERKKAEAELKTYTVRLERSNRELQDFAYIASHDLQEPLRKIQAFGERLVSKYSDEISEEGRSYAVRMQRDAERMQTMINDLLAYSRVATKAKPFTWVDLNEVAADAISDLETRLLETGGSVQADALPAIDGDYLQLKQLLQNLIGNALKFHKPETPPQVKVYGKIFSLLGSLEGKVFQLMVADNGIGFDEKYLDRIFEPFQRLHGRGTYEGSGIGLAICRKIAERHNGSITAKSTTGIGATFIVTLPVRQLKKAGD